MWPRLLQRQKAGLAPNTQRAKERIILKTTREILLLLQEQIYISLNTSHSLSLFTAPSSLSLQLSLPPVLSSFLLLFFLFSSSSPLLPPSNLSSLFSLPLSCVSSLSLLSCLIVVPVIGQKGAQLSHLHPPCPICHSLPSLLSSRSLPLNVVVFLHATAVFNVIVGCSAGGCKPMPLADGYSDPVKHACSLVLIRSYSS